MPLKAAITGVELLVDRAQLWEQSAAKHVSLSSQLAAVEALARRWRKHELSSWKLLLSQALQRHASGDSINHDLLTHKGLHFHGLYFFLAHGEEALHFLFLRACS